MIVFRQISQINSCLILLSTTPFLMSLVRFLSLGPCTIMICFASFSLSLHLKSKQRWHTNSKSSYFLFRSTTCCFSLSLFFNLMFCFDPCPCLSRAFKIGLSCFTTLVSVLVFCVFFSIFVAFASFDLTFFVQFYGWLSWNFFTKLFTFSS